MEAVMTYRTILTHVTRTANAAERFKLAAMLAKTERAHLVGTATTGAPRYMYSGSMFEGSGVIVADYLDAANKDAGAALALFEDASAAVESCETRLSEE